MRGRLRAGLCALLLAASMAAGAQGAAPLPVNVSARDRRVRLEGRFDTSDKEGPRCAWSASTVLLRFRGTAINAVIKEQGNDSFDVEVDGAKPVKLKLHEGQDTYSLAQDLAEGTHSVRLVKRTEAFVGTTQFVGFQVSEGGSLLSPPARSRRRIEVIGASICCGYGNEGADGKERFSPDTENANATFGALAARRFGAEYRCIAWSGRKMWPDNTISEVFERNLPNDAASKWEPGDWHPNVMLINLGTNDFGRENPEKEDWVNAYRAFIYRLRLYAPRAMIYVATGSMMNDETAGPRKPLATLKSYLQTIVTEEEKTGDRRIREIDFAPQRAEDGIGAGWHPSLKTHAIMADTFVQALERDLGWKQVAAP